MSVPPPPGQFGQPTPGSGGPWGSPQQGWQQAPPPKRGAAKWIIGAIALLAVIAVTVVVTVMVTGKDSGGDPGDPSTPQSDIASANDKGPVTIITEEPTCEKWTPIYNAYSDRLKNGWENRDPAIPSDAWTPEQRSQFEAVGQAMRGAADQTLALVPATPHRVVRELYEQFIVFARAYAAILPTYTEKDERLARAAVAASYALGSMCGAILYGSAGANASAVTSLPDPVEVSPPGDVANPIKFMVMPDQTCNDFEANLSSLDDETRDWRKISSKIAASQWTPEQRAINESAIPVFSSYADKFLSISERSDNLQLRDFAAFAAQYFRAYAHALPNYATSDAYLSDVGFTSMGLVRQACLSAKA